jgi:peptide/nickel transport system substrate-binding protein
VTREDLPVDTNGRRLRLAAQSTSLEGDPIESNGTSPNLEWHLAELVDSVAAEIDRAEDTLSLKSFARGKSFAINQLHLDLEVTVRRDAAGRILFRTVDPNETSATVLKLDFSHVLPSQLQGLRKPLDQVIDPRDLASLPGIDTTTIIRLNAIAIYSVDDLERYTQTPAMVAEVSRKTGIPETDIRGWRGMPFLSAVKPSSGPPGAAVVLEGGNFGVDPDPNAVVFFQGTAATIMSWSDTRLGVMLPPIGGEGVLFAIVGGEVTNTLSWQATTVDLFVGGIAASPPTPVGGEPVILQADLVNRGSGDSGPFQVLWEVDEEVTPVALHGALRSGQHSTESSIRIQPTLPSGTHTIRFTADPNGDLPDIDRANSTFVVTLAVAEPVRLAIGDHRPVTLLDPLRVADAEAAAGTLALIFRGLGRRDPVKGAFALDLAQIPTLSSSDRIATFRLRDDLRFHNDSPLTAEDVIFTYKMGLESDSPWRELLSSTIEDLGTLDESTVQFSLHSGFWSVSPQVWTLGIVPVQVYEQDRDGFGLRPIGCGPFVVEDFVPAKALTLRGFGGFALGPPRLNRITIDFMPDSLTVRRAAELDQVMSDASLDAAILPYSPELAADLEAAQNWNLFPVPGESSRLLHVQSPNVFERVPNAFDTAWNAHAWYVLTGVTVRAPKFPVAAVVGGATVEGFVPLSGPAPTGLELTLMSDNSAALFVGGGNTLTIPVKSGARRVPFAVATSPVTQDAHVIINAALNDGERLATTLTVQSPRLLSVSLDRTTLTVGGSVSGMVQLNGPAPVGGLSVGLASSSIASATVPASVRIEAGNNAARFILTAGSTPGVATVTTSMAGSPSLTSPSLTVHPRLAGLALRLPKQTIAGGAAIATISLDGAAPSGGTEIELASSRPDLAVPASATTRVDPGRNARDVSWTGRAVGNIEVIARRDGAERRDTLTVLPRITGISLAPSSLVGGAQTVQATIQLETAAPVNMQVGVSSSHPTVASPQFTGVTIPAGSGLATISIVTQAVSQVTSVTITSFHRDVDQALTGARKQAALVLNPKAVKAKEGEKLAKEDDEKVIKEDGEKFDLETSGGAGTLVMDEPGGEPGFSVSEGMDDEQGATASRRSFIRAEERPPVGEQALDAPKEDPPGARRTGKRSRSGR